MKEYVVTEEMFLINFLRIYLTKLSKNNIKSLLSKEMVLVNNKVQTKYDFLVKKNDRITIRETKIRGTKLKNDLKILYEDDDIIAINKPSGLLTIATSKEKEMTLYHIVMNYMKSKNKNNKIFIIHRLDKETSGIVLFAKNQKAKNMFQKSWETNVKKRCYYAICEGIFDKKEGIIKSYLTENSSFMVYSTQNKKEGKLAVTTYKVCKETNNYSLLDIDIKTGRKNQIRVHLKEAGHIIVGDKKYGSNNNIINRMALHAYKLEFLNPITNRNTIIRTEMPTLFKKIIK